MTCVGSLADRLAKGSEWEVRLDKCFTFAEKNACTHNYIHTYIYASHVLSMQNLHMKLSR